MNRFYKNVSKIKLKPKNKLSWILVLVIFISCKDSSTGSESTDDESNVPSAAQIIEEMGAGFNLGNTFDNGANSTTFENIAPIVVLYERAGMKHIRIPTTWFEGFGGNSLANEEGEVNFEHPRFLELKKVIDFALDRDLYVVLNAHHEREFKENYNGSDEFDDKFATLWRDIATYFKDYDYHLIFELLNEPEGAFGTWGGTVSPTNPVGIALTRNIMEVGVDAIRATGGNNIKRVVMIATNGQGNQGQIDDVYPNKDALPGDGEDAYISIQVHTYDPWSFCGQTGDNSNFPGTEEIENRLRSVAAHGRTLGVPINYGEYGVGRNGNQSQRNTALVRGYYKTIVRVARDEKMSTSVWDDRGWFGLVSGNTQSGYDFIYNIVSTMLEE
tara:strand:+ start:21056 stop:22213 length:1158 start_codon:yes stop_codon:yes gene_type:complete